MGFEPAGLRDPLEGHLHFLAGRRFNKPRPNRITTLIQFAASPPEHWLDFPVRVIKTSTSVRVTEHEGWIVCVDASQHFVNRSACVCIGGKLRKVVEVCDDVRSVFIVAHEGFRSVGSARIPSGDRV